MKVKLYKNFKKRKNSTLRPSGDFLEIDCTLKNGTSIVNPTIQLQLAFDSDYSNYNYCQIPDFGRFYYIRDLVWNNSIAEFVLVSDKMASFKTDIGAFTGLAARSGSSFDGTIPDTLLFPSDDIVFDRQIGVAGTTGGYIVSVVGEDGIKYVFLNFSEMLILCQSLSGIWASIVNQTSGINACYRTNLSAKQLGATISKSITAGFGAAKFTFTGAEISLSPKRINLFDYELTPHIQAEIYGDFLNSQKYRSFYLVNSGFGMAQLPTTAADVGTATVVAVVSPDNGSAVLQIKTNERVITTVNTSFYASIPFVGSAVNMTGVAGGVVGTASGIGAALAATSPAGAIVGGLGAGISAISGAISALPEANVRGTLSGIAALDPNFEFFSINRKVKDNDNNNQGRPYCRNYNAASGGYIEYERVNLSTTARADEKNEIESIMERGFYYE